MTCHHVEPGAEGPDGLPPIGTAWRDVSARYKGQKDAAAKLTHTVMAGANPCESHWKGKVSGLAMPPNAVAIKAADAKRLVKWILSLDAARKSDFSRPAAQTTARVVGSLVQNRQGNWLCMRLRQSGRERGRSPMLTRLRVKGFKNLREVDLSFGPFTCIAGRNGVGKSNVFDAITLLSDLASLPLVKAATRVRGAEDQIAGIEALFARTAGADSQRMEFIAEMVVSGEVTDDYDRTATPQATYLQYALELRYDPARAAVGKEPLYIERESLIAKPSSKAAGELRFQTSKVWLKQHLHGPGNRKGAFIETVPTDHGEPSIQLHGEGKGGRPAPVPARQAPQTVLSGVNTSSYPTTLAAKREMQSWRLLQLEPTALRMADQFRDEAHVSATGRHLPNAVLRCGSGDEVTQRLSELIPGMRAVQVDSDKTRSMNTLKVTMKDHQSYAASALSDGTLRFLALAVLASDARLVGLTCLEEPENGIHPLRIPQMLSLVRSLADLGSVDDAAEVNTIRQVIINTHSPLVVAELRDDELLMAETLGSGGARGGGGGGEWVNFRPLPGTWRAEGLPETRRVSRGELAGYLGAQALAGKRERSPSAHTVAQRLADWLQADLFAAH